LSFAHILLSSLNNSKDYIENLTLSNPQKAEIIKNWVTSQKDKQTLGRFYKLSLKDKL
jgi:hypothetical protein